MIGKNKEFDEKLFEKYDIPAREIIKEKLKDYVLDNPESIYKEDMIFINLDKSCSFKYLELQVCANWYSDKYPYEKPFVFERKGFFHDDTLYIIFDKYMNNLLMFSKKFLSKKPVRLHKYSRFLKFEVDFDNVLQIPTNFLDINEIYFYNKYFHLK